jgi:PAS domain S-box-containing protein
MTLVPRGSALGHAIAVCGVAGLVLLHGLAGQPASAHVLLPSLLTVIVIAGWLGGFGPALVGTLLASLVTLVALPPRGFLAATPAGLLRLAVLAACGLLVALLARWAHGRGRAAEEEAARVRDSEARFQLATEAVQGVVYDLDFRTGEWRSSEGIARIVGSRPPGPTAPQSWWMERIHPEDRARLAAGFEQLAASGEPTWSGRYRVRHDDGRWVHVWDNARILRDAAGGITRIVGYSVDVSAEVAAQEALRRSEERFQLATSVVRGVMYDVDLASGHTWRSEGLRELIGIPPEATEPTPAWWLARMHPDDQARFGRSEIDPERARLDDEYRVRHEDGRWVRVWDRMRIVRDEAGRPVRAVGYTMDVSALYEAREARREADERLRLAIDGAGMGAWELDAATDRVVWSDSFFRMLGYAPAPGGAGHVDLLRERLHPDDRDAMLEAFEGSRRAGTPYRHEYRILRADDGAVRRIASFGRHELDDAGRAVRSFGITFDVTEREQAQEALRQRAEELESLLSVLPAAVWYAHDPAAATITGNAFANRIVPPAVADATPPAHPGFPRVLRDGAAVPVDALPLHRAAATGEAADGIEITIELGDGARVELLGGATPLFGPDGRRRGAVGAFVDITERKRIESELRDARRLFEKIADATPGILYLYDLVEQRNVYANRGLTAVLGYTPEELVAMGSAMGDRLVHPDDLRAGPTGVATVASLGPDGVREHVLRMRHVDGAWRHLRCRETVFSRDDDGTPRRMLGIAHDVTDELATVTALTESEERLRESERRLRELADAMPQIVFVNRADGALEYVNRQWEAYTGEPYENDSRVHERVHAEDRDRMLATWALSRANGEPYESEFRMLGRDGAYRWFLSRAVPVRDAQGEVVRWYGTSTNIDEQKRAQAALQHGEARQRDLADAALRINASLSVAKPLRDTLQLVTDLARDIVGAHQALLMASHEDHDGQTVHAISLGEKYARFRDYDEPVTGRGIYSLVSRFNRPMRLTQAELEAHPAFTRFRGTAREHPPLRGWLAVPLLGRDGRNLGILQFSDKRDGGDFTAEDEAVATQMAAMAAVGMENWALVEQIRDADRRKDEFLATLAHELRNPLAPISNSLELLRRAPADPAILGRARGTMERQVGQMVRLIDDLLDASRISRGKLVLRPQRITLESVVTQALETARPHLEAAGHLLEVSLPPEPVWLDADPTRLAQVFGNLLDNASKYSPPRAEVRVDARCRDGRVEVRVTDTGTGIPADQLGSIFEMFSQVDRSLERTSGGLGIGLALVRGLVEMHGGTVEARSDGPGQGSAFTVALPVATAPEPFDEAPEGPGAPVARRGRILVADDNRDGADSLAALLRRSGHEVHVVYDGEEAVAAAARLRPHVALLDLGMPRLNGHDAAQAIRALPGGQQMTLVALTGWGDEATRRRTRESGFDGHLTKPVDYPTLLGLIGALTEARGAAAT